jgi:hypothetical protein
MSSDGRKDVSKQIGNIRAARKKQGTGEGTYRREKDKQRAWHGRKKERVREPMQNRGS